MPSGILDIQVEPISSSTVIANSDDDNCSQACNSGDCVS